MTIEVCSQGGIMFFFYISVMNSHIVYWLEYTDICYTFRGRQSDVGSIEEA
jgi:hypothetical protein